VDSYTDSQTSNNMQTTSDTQNTKGGSVDKTVLGVFASRQDAEAAVNELRRQGFTTEEINIISKDQNKNSNRETYDDDITDGALTGGTLGGIGGLILGAGALAIPGIGPIIAAGPIAAALSGVVAGGVTGGLVDWGIPTEVSQRYEQSVAQGDILAVIRTSSSKVKSAAQILRQNSAKDVESHDAD
jgi:hypothetical protein